jgi:hypothetical protein
LLKAPPQLASALRTARPTSPRRPHPHRLIVLFQDFQAVGLFFLLELVSLKSNSLTVVRAMTDAGVIPILTQFISRPHSLEFVVMALKTLSQILLVNETARDLVASVGVFSQVMKADKNDPTFIMVAVIHSGRG